MTFGFPSGILSMLGLIEITLSTFEASKGNKSEIKAIKDLTKVCQYEIIAMKDERGHWARVGTPVRVWIRLDESPKET